MNPRPYLTIFNAMAKAPKTTRKFALPMMLLLGLLGLTACGSGGSSQVQTSPQENSQSNQLNAANNTQLVITLQPGQLLSLVAPLSKTDPDQQAASRAAGKAYRQQAFPLARGFGLNKVGDLNVDKTVVGKFTPPAFSLFTWPNQAAENKLLNHPDWPAIKALRPQAWQELKIYTHEVQEAVDLTFDPNKFYTLAIAWFDPEHPDDYHRYMANIKEQVLATGAKFMLKMNHPRFEAHAQPLRAPGQITLVEWPSREALATLQTSDLYKANIQYFRSGVNRFEFHFISPKMPKRS